MSRPTFLGVASLFAGIACSHPQPKSPSGTAAGPQLQAKWVERQTQTGRVQLTAHIQVFAPFAAPLEVKVVVPEGVTVDGPTEVEIPAPRFATTIDRDLNVSYSALPKQDLLLIVDVRNPNFGMHAEDVYRFGRPAPTVATPKATGPRLKVGAVDFGRSVPLATP